MNAITIPIDDETQRKLTEICARVGWTVQDAVQDFFHKAIQEDSPVIDEMNPIYRKKNLDFLEKSIRQAREGKVIRVTMDGIEVADEQSCHSL